LEWRGREKGAKNAQGLGPRMGEYEHYIEGIIGDREGLLEGGNSERGGHTSIGNWRKEDIR